MSSLKHRNLVLFLAFVLAAALLVTIVVRYRSITNVTEIVEALPSEVELALQDVDYMHSEAGVARWRLEAKRAARLATEGQLAVKNIVLTFYNEQGVQQTVVHADEGDADKEFSEIYLRGNVLVESERGYRLVADQLVYRQGERKVFSESPVVFDVGNMSVRGHGLELDLESQAMVVYDHVEAILTIAEPKKDR